MTVTVDWGDVEKNVLKAIADVEGPIRRKAGKNAGFKVGEALEKATPVLVTGKTLLKDTVSVGPVREDGHLMIGYGRAAYYRAHHVNMGTIYQSGQHFVEKTVESEVETAMREYMDELKKGLKL